MCSPHRSSRWFQQDPMFIRHRHGHHGPGGPGGRGVGPFGAGPFGGGPFGGGFGGGPFGGGPRGRGRKRRGDVRLALLMLLAEEPRNGYQLMQTLEERSDGHWRPSPGSVYPALSQLEDEGLIRSTQADSGRAFEITDAGREHLAERREERAPWEPAEDDGSDDARKTLRHTMGQTAAAAWQVAQAGDAAQIARAIELMNETRRALYRLLAGDAGDID